jgi:hypothetical protein
LRKRPSGALATIELQTLCKDFLLDNDCSFPRYNQPVSSEPVFQNGHFLEVPLQNILLDFADAKKNLSGEAYNTVIACSGNIN